MLGLSRLLLTYRSHLRWTVHLRSARGGRRGLGRAFLGGLEAVQQRALGALRARRHNSLQLLPGNYARVSKLFHTTQKLSSSSQLGNNFIA